MVSAGARRQVSMGVVAAGIAGVLSPGCFAIQRDPTDATTGASSGTTDSTGDGSTSIGPGSLSHSATSATPPSTDPTATGDAPTTGGGTSDASSGTGRPDTATTSTASGPGTSSTGGPGTTGGGVDGYGPCAEAEPRCPDGQFCFEAEEIEGTFCAPPCEMWECPEVDSGAQAVCALVPDMEPEPTHCALVCDLLLREPGCPVGTSCKPIPLQEVGVCTAP